MFTMYALPAVVRWRDIANLSINIGSGIYYSISQVALELSKVLGKTDIEPLISGKFRIGDIRHCLQIYSGKECSWV